jgi:hypothetical protein
MQELNEDFIEEIASEFDSCLICDLLDIEPEELLNRFEDRLLDNIHKFKGWEEDE